jgi:Ca2+/Na+ antiporter
VTNLHTHQNQYYEISAGFVVLSVVALIAVMIPVMIFVLYGFSRAASKFDRRVSIITVVMLLVVACMSFVSESDSFEMMMVFVYAAWAFIFYGILALSVFVKLIIAIIKMLGRAF